MSDFTFDELPGLELQINDQHADFFTGGRTVLLADVRAKAAEMRQRTSSWTAVA